MVCQISESLVVVVCCCLSFAVFMPYDSIPKLVSQSLGALHKLSDSIDRLALMLEFYRVHRD